MSHQPIRAPLADRADPPAAIRIPSRGADWRALTAEDVPAVVKLLHISEAADGTAVRTTHAEMEALFSAEHSAYGAFDPDQGLVCYGYVRLDRTADAIEAICSGAVHPQWRGRKLGTGIVEWQIDTARHMLAASGAEGDARIVHIVDESIAGIAPILIESGFTAREWSTLLRRDLSEPITPIELGRTLTVEPWTTVWDEAVRRAHAQSSGDLELEGFEHMVREWSFVALDRTSDRAKIAGYVVASRYDEDFLILGFEEAAIGALGVMAKWRGQGVGRSLVAHVLTAAREAGMSYASIDLDSSFDPSAAGLYSDTGFTAVVRSTHYVIDL